MVTLAACRTQVLDREMAGTRTGSGEPIQEHEVANVGKCWEKAVTYEPLCLRCRCDFQVPTRPLGRSRFASRPEREISLPGRSVSAALSCEGERARDNALRGGPNARVPSPFRRARGSNAHAGSRILPSTYWQTR